MEQLLIPNVSNFLSNQMMSSVLLYQALEKVEIISETQLCGNMKYKYI